MTKHIIIILFWMLAITSVKATDTLPLCEIRNYTVRDGLIGTTMNILQDSKGFIWVSTWNGLNKFDGYTFENYKALSGDSCALTNNRITYIHKGLYDDIWCCTYDNRVYLFDNWKERFIDILLPIESKIKHTNTVLKLYPLTKGITWIVCTDGYSFRVDEHVCKKGEGITFYSSSNNDFKGGRISQVYQDVDGDEWILTDKGISIIGKKKIDSDFPFNYIHEIGSSIYLVSTSGKMAYYNRISGRLTFVDMPYRVSKVHATHITDEQMLTLCTENGLIFYDIKTKSFKQIDVSTPAAPSNVVQSFFKDRQAEVWVHTNDPGVTRIDLSTGEKQHFTVPFHDEVAYDRDITNIIFEDATGVLWLVPNKGNLCYYDRAEKKLKTYYTTLNHTQSPFLPFIFTYYLDKQGNFWFTSKHGVVKMSFFSPTYTLSRIDNGLESRAFFLDRQQRLWVASKSGLLRIYDAKGALLGYLTPQGTISHAATPFIGHVYCFLEDKEGQIWLGTKANGLIRLQEKNKNQYTLSRFVHHPNDIFSLSNNSIYSICQDKQGRIWLGSYGGGLNLLSHTQGGGIYFIHSDNRLKTYPTTYSQKVRFVTETAQGVMMVGTTEGLLTFSGSLTQPEEIKFHRNIRKKEVASSLGSNDVMHIYVDSKQEIYVSTFTGGISKVMSKNLLCEDIEFKTYNAKSGLASDLVFSMKEDAQQNLWIVLENSLSKFDRKQETFDNYNFPFLEQGFQFSEAIPVWNHRGQLVFGSNQGFIEITPTLMKKSDYVPTIAFTGLKINGMPSTIRIDRLNVLTLQPSQRNISFQFAAFDYTEPREIHYAYRLEGLEKHWNYADNSRSANYINLPAGEYTLQVRSTNSDGVWRDNIRTLSVQVLPTFWETRGAWVFYVLLFVIFTGTIVYVLFYIYRLHHQMNMEQQLSDIKLKFFTNVSHELRTPLTLITGPLTEVLDYEPLSPIARRHLTVVDKNTNRMLRLINEILDFRKIENKKMKVLLEQTDILVLLRRIMENFHSAAEEKQLDYQFQADREELYGWIDRDKFEKIFFNLLSNAFKHTPPGKSITVAVVTAAEHVTISIIDQGSGIDPKKQKLLFQRFETLSTFGRFSSGIGLSLVKDLLALHHGHVDVVSQPGVGSRFDVRLPLHKEAFEGDPQVEFPLPTHEDKPMPLETKQEQLSLFEAERVSTKQPSKKIDADRLLLLIVEDNNELRQFLRDILSDSYTVMEAVDGQEGLAAARKHIPDMIIADVMMPVMDGIEMVKELKADREICHIPIILLTAKSTLEDRITGIEQGIDDYITKPFSPLYLRTRITSLLRQRKLLQEVYRNHLSQSNKASGSIGLIPSQPQIASYDEQFLQQVMAHIEAQMDNADLTVDDFAYALNLGRTVFYKKLKAIVGLAPNDFIRDIRLKRAAQLLDAGEHNLSEIAYMTGFNDPKYFSRCFKRKMGVTPSEYKSGQR